MTFLVEITKLFLSFLDITLYLLPDSVSWVKKTDGRNTLKTVEVTVQSDMNLLGLAPFSHELS